MCIIAFKPQGTNMPSWKTLKNCFDNNDNGAGFMWADRGRVEIRKGFMTFGDLKQGIKQSGIGRDHTVAIHFRLATHGLKSKGMCHPFPVSRSEWKLTCTELRAKVAIAHNGIMNEVMKGLPAHDAHLSDTAIFVRDYLSYLPITQRTIDIIDASTKGNKLLIMKGDGAYYMTGEWVEDNGIYYSNSGYKREMFIFTEMYRKAYQKWARWDWEEEEEDTVDSDVSDRICPLCFSDVIEDWHDTRLCMKCGHQWESDEDLTDELKGYTVRDDDGRIVREYDYFGEV